jgi:IS605 OrfB family transposase
LWEKRNNVIKDCILKSCRYIVEYCKSNDIGNIVLGFNKDMTRSVDLGKSNNQKITNLPMGKIKDALTYMCNFENINLYIQEESYTSKASFWDKDPVEKCDYSGKRIKRGLYKTSTGTLTNADVNGALNILKKSKVVGLNTLYCRGDVDTPKRIRLS